MQLDSGYHCQQCDTKAHLALWHAISPDSRTETEKILCVADAAVLEILGWKLDSVTTSN